jgi:hypothetical protein
MVTHHRIRGTKEKTLVKDKVVVRKVKKKKKKKYGKKIKKVLRKIATGSQMGQYSGDDPTGGAN